MNETRHPTGLDLQAYHDGELSPAEAGRVAAHCGDCAACRAELDGLARVDGLLAGIDAPEVPRSVWPAVAAARRGGRETRLGPAFGFAAAAACAAGIVIGILVGPVQFSAESATQDVAWTGPSSLLGDSDGASLLGVYESDPQ